MIPLWLALLAGAGVVLLAGAGALVWALPFPARRGRVVLAAAVVALLGAAALAFGLGYGSAPPPRCPPCPPSSLLAEPDEQTQAAVFRSIYVLPE